jgi:MarR family transcriptional regulator, transcriptional regulator for hemolysin
LLACETKTIENMPAFKRNLSLNIAIIARQLRNRFDQSVAKLGVTRAQWTLIAVVAHSPGSTQREIAEALDMTEASAGRLVDRLCTEGLLTRKARDADRRAYSVYLTKAAGPLVQTLDDIANLDEEAVFAGFTEADLQQLSVLLEQVYRNIGSQKARLLR